MEGERIQAKKVKKTEHFGSGCMLQGVGVICLIGGFFFGIPGIVLGILLFLLFLVYGAQKSVFWICGNCKNPLAGKQVTICPTCKADLV
jgi:hypothetical protein